MKIIKILKEKNSFNHSEVFLKKNNNRIEKLTQDVLDNISKQSIKPFTFP
jgi:hypothetical protein